MTSRYSRQELFEGIGMEGQSKIRSSAVTIIGCGALGSLLSEALCRGGVGRIIIVDRDFVEESNLQRQALFTESDAAESLPKAVAAAAHLQAINSDVEVIPVVADLNPDSIRNLVRCDLLLDGTDNFQTRYLINDYAWSNAIPWIYGGCVGSTGVASAFTMDGPCLRCVFEMEPAAGAAPTCDTTGILWPAVAAVVSFQVSAALKILCGKEIAPEIFTMDVWQNHFRIVSLANAKRENCVTCVMREYPSLKAVGPFEATLCGRDAVQVCPANSQRLNLHSIAEKWSKISQVRQNAFLVKSEIEGYEIVVFPDGRAIIKGTTDPVRARSIYARYVGV